MTRLSADGSPALQPAPTHLTSLDCRKNSLNSNVIHQLTIVEALGEQPEDQRPILPAFEKKRKQRRKQIEAEEQDIEENQIGQATGGRVNGCAIGREMELARKDVNAG